MKRAAGFVSVVAIALLACAPAAAGTFGFGLTGGAGIPIGDFSDGFDTGFAGGAYAEYWFNDQGAFGIDFTYSHNSANDQITNFFNGLTELGFLLGGYTTVSADLDVTASMLEVGLHGKWAPPTASAVRPYVQSGFGVYNTRAAIEGPVTADGIIFDVDEDDNSSDFGINVGAGMLFRASPAVSFGVAGAFHNVFTDDNATQFFTVGAQLHFSTGAR